MTTWACLFNADNSAQLTTKANFLLASLPANNKHRDLLGPARADVVRIVCYRRDYAEQVVLVA